MQFRKIVPAGLVAALSVHGAVAHSWIEQLNVIAPNGTMIEPAGFPRGNYKRNVPGFGDDKMVWLIPPNSQPINQIDGAQMMCRPEQQAQTQAVDSPRLTAVPGAYVALRYQENGHVTIPATQKGKPANRGTNFVYYTDSSRPDDKFLEIHRVWNPEGTAGDNRGRLISTQSYDDGQCYQINGEPISQTRQQQFRKTADPLQGANLWCQQDVQIPADAKPGSTITLYWVWDWPTMPGTEGFPDGKQEIYTTCMDIDIVDDNGAVNKAAKIGDAQFVDQDFMSAAVANQFNNIAVPTGVPNPELIPFIGVPVAGAVNPPPAPVETPAPTTTAAPIATTTPAPAPETPAATPGPEAVTVTVTVTAPAEIPPPVTVTVTAGESTESPAESCDSMDMVTETQTVDMVTVTMTISETAAEPTDDAAAAPNSMTENPYRLRARAPFYVAPKAKESSSGAGH